MRSRLYQGCLGLLMITLSLGLMIIMARVPDREPPPGPDILAGVEALFFSYLPYYHEDCSPRAAKKGLAWAHKSRDIWAAQRLCLAQGSPWLDWDLDGLAQYDGYIWHLPMLWSPAEYAAFLAWLADTNYEGPLAVGNECDRPDQCNDPTRADPEMPYRDTAQLILDARQACPGCQIIGPLFSNADAGQISLKFWATFTAMGGSPQDIWAASKHIYPDQRGLSAGAKIDEYYEAYMIPAGLGDKRIWVTEVGVYRSTEPGILARWLRELEADERVSYYFGFSPYTSPSSPFAPYFNWDTGQVTVWGLEYRAPHR